MTNTPADGAGNYFSGGDIYLLTAPVGAQWGINRFLSMLCGGSFGIEYEAGREIWIVGMNARRTRLKIFHADAGGFSIVTRSLVGRALFEAVAKAGTGYGRRPLTRGQLRRLCLDGTIEGPWQNAWFQRCLKGA